MRKIHILEVPNSKHAQIVGGVDTMIDALVGQLKAKAKVSIFQIGSWECKKLEHQVIDNVDYYTMRLRLPLDKNHPIRGFLMWLLEFPFLVWHLRKLLKDASVDVIHLHMAHEFQAYFRVIHWLGGPPYILTVHRGEIVDFERLPRFTQKLALFIMKGASKIVAVAEWLARETEQKFPILKPIAYVHNGIAPEFPDKSDRTNPTHPVLPEKFFLMVGVFGYYKGHDQAIKAWPLVKGVHPDLHLVIAGIGALEKHYRDLIKEIDCEDNIHLIGQQPRQVILNLLASCKGFIFPSRSEGFAYSLLEAGLCKTPVVCTDIPPFRELIDDAVNGLIVPLDSPIELSKAILKIADHPEESHKLAESLYNKIISQFLSSHMAESYLKIFQSVISEK